MSIDDTFGPLSNYEDVCAFHEKFGLMPKGTIPKSLDSNTAKFRILFLEEELNEFKQAVAENDLEGMADALIDLVYVAMGTSVLMQLPWQQLWDEVQRANMTKVRADDETQSKRGSSLDVIKPAGWKAPDIKGVLDNAGK
ncbi:MAG: NTP-PPase [Caudovirales sp. ctOwN3]|nr:MAG: NTP-PPase [Caudovirales sp. ctOwN3]